MNIGDIIYKVTAKGNQFTRKKLKMIDADGVEWYRYDRELFIYDILELRYCGNAIYTITGSINKETLYNEYYFLYPNGDIHEESLDIHSIVTIEDYIDAKDNWFWSKDEAEQYIKEQFAE